MRMVKPNLPRNPCKIHEEADKTIHVSPLHLDQRQQVILCQLIKQAVAVGFVV